MIPGRDNPVIDDVEASIARRVSDDISAAHKAGCAAVQSILDAASGGHWCDTRAKIVELERRATDAANACLRDRGALFRIRMVALLQGDSTIAFEPKIEEAT